MKSVYFAIVFALLVIAQINAYSVVCKKHFIPKEDLSCYDFQTGKPGIRVRMNDLTSMNPCKFKIYFFFFFFFFNKIYRIFFDLFILKY